MAHPRALLGPLGADGGRSVDTLVVLDTDADGLDGDSALSDLDMLDTSIEAARTHSGLQTQWLSKTATEPQERPLGAAPGHSLMMPSVALLLLPSS